MSLELATLHGWLADAGLSNLACSDKVANPTGAQVVLLSATFPRKTLLHTVIVFNDSACALTYTIQVDKGAGWVDMSSQKIPAHSFDDLRPDPCFEPGEKIRIGTQPDAAATGTSHVDAQYIMLPETT